MHRVHLNRSRFEQARSAIGGSSFFPRPAAVPVTPSTAAASNATNSSSSPGSNSQPPHWNNEVIWRRCATTPSATGTYWYRMVDGSVSPATALNVYLPENQSLSENQRKTFWKIAADWICLDPNNRSKSEDVVASELASLWDQGHFLSIGAMEHSGGYGGRMSPQHVKKILQATGNDILEAQFQFSQLQARQRTLQRSMPPSRYARPVNPSVFASLCPAPTPLPAPPMYPSSRFAPRVPTLPPPPSQPKPTAKPPPPKRMKQERRIRVVKGMTTASIEALNHEDIRQALLKLNRSSSNKRKKTLEVRLAKALKEQSDGFEMTFTRPCFT
jgi:hypothetical protein